MNKLWCLDPQILRKLLIDAESISDHVKSVELNTGNEGSEYKFLLLKSSQSEQLFYRLYALNVTGKFYNLKMNCVLVDEESKVLKEVCIYDDGVCVEMTMPMLDELVHTLPKVISEYTVACNRGMAKSVFPSENESNEKDMEAIVNAFTNVQPIFTDEESAELAPLLVPGVPLIQR